MNVVSENFLCQSASVFLVNYPILLDGVFAEVG